MRLRDILTNCYWRILQITRTSNTKLLKKLISIEISNTAIFNMRHVTGRNNVKILNPEVWDWNIAPIIKTNIIIIISFK